MSTAVITFKVCLAKDIIQHFESARQEPVVDVRSDLDGFRYPLLQMQRE